VLDVIEEEGILDNVGNVGQYLEFRLHELAKEHEVIGDIRGKGLYYGVELVTDRQTKQPAGKEAGFVREDLRNKGVLVNTTGPLNNVIKVRPPLVFSKANVDYLVDRFESALDRVRKRGPGSFGSD
jgi:4-aminobutyrate aminotransferase-like enzyme